MYPKLYPYILVIVLVVLCTTAFRSTESSRSVTRYASITGLKAEKVAYYKKLHAKVWPSVLRKIKACHIRNYSIFLKEIDGQFFLFSYFEYAGQNIKLDMQKMASDPETQRWWKETDPCQQPLSDAQEKGEIWSDMAEVFHTD
ncbi:MULTISPECIES: L-rhamnose mutarotase [Sphingobacterium]|jgi:L-rhamnose mutarotase|uniref:L-rhamnose mutarotase n=1 Tax=Sphingobacterium TaxID=28453 RepID=UPI000B222FB6|nr:MULTISPECIES: L-rhamnose mutarotase [Sphingobacterium]MDF2852017.1 L-rhamnose 1-epimerase [Sphingobacterium multivorum]